MPRPLRSEVFRPQEIAILHCVQRCVRRAYLSGVDSVTGTDYSYRKEWIRQRIEKLASVFGIDVLTYAILSNHLHVVLRSRPDVVAAWSDRQVALRWLQIFPGKRIEEQLGDPTTADVDSLANDPERMAVIRLRLSDVSWFMKALSEPIARFANKQEKCTGCFWEGRFKAQRLLDEAALLACCMYVDLNPVRAAMAESPESSTFTSAYDRIKAAQGKTIESAAAPMRTINRDDAAKILKSSTPEELANRRKSARERRGPRIAKDAWLAPLTLNPRMVGPAINKEGLRASDKGFLNMSLDDYIALLFWTGRQGREDKKGKITVGACPDLGKVGDRRGDVVRFGMEL
jgi:REP element-mobilizing transposase RayT